MNAEVSAVLVGCGSISHTWLAAAREVPGLTIVGLVDLVTDNALRRAEEFGLAVEVGTSLADVLTRTRPALVFDCTTPEARLDVATTALAAGCHVLAEKPLAMSIEGARKIIACARESGKRYATVQNYRYQAGCRRLARFLRSGQLGDLTSCNSTFSVGAHFADFRRRMRHVLLLDMAVHTFDLARLFLGSDPISVYCKAWNPRGSWYDHGASAAAIFEFDNGGVYTYHGSWCAEGLRTTWAGQWRITGTRGSVTWDGADDFKAQVVAEEGGFLSKLADVAVPSLDAADVIGGHTGVIGDFVARLRAGQAPETDCADNIKSLAMVLAAIDSAEIGRPVLLPCA